MLEMAETPKAGGGGAALQAVAVANIAVMSWRVLWPCFTVSSIIIP